ncbi:PREDICTED: uncharacterized protein LOC104732496 isoform X2 [Camelina sativa]|uniref:Uncharacterized protein LOC104732496 isoform X2 n=1 Tax=Camelina sativa TaxID=90675 RepID=A0ABM0V3U0_CAMSA|nr:PREDICTED: uncharacterized protein LOC104732496 isoform X2 [Camelina sativa]
MSRTIVISSWLPPLMPLKKLDRSFVKGFTRPNMLNTKAMFIFYLDFISIIHNLVTETDNDLEILSLILSSSFSQPQDEEMEIVGERDSNNRVSSSKRSK